MPILNPSHRRSIVLAVTCFWMVVSFAQAEALAQQSANVDPAANADQLRFFEQKIRPLLHTKCVSCHGATKQNGELRLDSREGLLKGGESGAAIDAHDSAASLLMEAVRYESFEMPPNEQLSKQEIADLQKWVDAGAVWPMMDGKSVRLEGAAFTDEERSFWSLQPVTHPAPPEVPEYRNPIDRFVMAKMQAAGLQPATQASAEVLVRRLYFGLLGIPPSPADLQQFGDVQTGSEGFDGRWRQLTRQLLDDRRYGEHWARYWLDVVRYSESDGFRADFYRPEAWRYRDYVVNAFNNDKPYDHFLSEQLAGDELYPDSIDAQVATGYLRTYLYEYNQRDARTQWQDILNQVTDVTGEAFMGLSMGCARCHDHKFDPILQRDYFRLQAAFGSMLPVDDVPVASSSRRQQHAEQIRQWKQKAAALHRQRDELRAPYLAKAARSAITKFPEDVQAVVAKARSDQSPLDVQIADLVNRQVLFEYDRLKFSSDDKKKLAALDQQIKALAGDRPSDLPTAMTVTDTGTKLAEIHVGANQSLPTVAPGGLSILDEEPFPVQPTEHTTGARSALAQWLTDPEHPLTARVFVNRVWQHHFGTGLVSTASDFGSLGGRPTHPELLDWLASEFVAHGYSIKWLQFQILTSATYRMSSFHRNAAACEQIDPGNELRWRFDIRRLNAEQIRDAMLCCSGGLSSEIGGPSTDGDSKRRSLYVKQKRNSPDALLKSLDGTDGLNSIAKRNTTTTPVQALNLMNGKWVNERAAEMAHRVIAEARSKTPSDLVDTAYQIAFGRLPSESDRQLAGGWLADSQEPFVFENSKPPSLSAMTGRAAAVNSEQASLILNSGTPWKSGSVTVLAVFRLDSLYPDATVRTIASVWNSDNKSPGWSIGVTSTKSGYQPRNLIVQVVTDEGYEVVPSGLRPELGVPYLMAVTISSQKSGQGRAAFYLRPISEERLSRSLVDFKTTNGLKAVSPLVIGGRYKQNRHRWDGLIDQVAVFSQPLERTAIDDLFQQKLSSDVLQKYDPVAAWDFDGTTDQFAALTPETESLHQADGSSTDPLHRAVADLCHVLLNSNEFVYLD